MHQNRAKVQRTEVQSRRTELKQARLPDLEKLNLVALIHVEGLAPKCHGQLLLALCWKGGPAPLLRFNFRPWTLDIAFVVVYSPLFCKQPRKNSK